MKLDALIRSPNLDESAQLATTAENAGFNTLWISETRHNPFLSLVLAAEHTKRVRLGTAIALAFTRSPMDLAYTAWNLQAFSDGRLVLGLGTQVKAHIERRFSMKWEAPRQRLREVVTALRTIWDSWQNRKPLNFQGRYYNFSLMNPVFDPGPIRNSRIPIYISAVNAGMFSLAGELCDGVILHPFHTINYLREIAMSNLDKGLSKVARKRNDMKIVSIVFVVVEGQSTSNALEEVRRQIAFYASTPTYRSVLAIHGWEKIGLALSELARQGRWEKMAAEVSDEMLEQIAVTGTLEEVASQVKARYDGLVDEVCLYPIGLPSFDELDWKKALDIIES